MNQLPHPHTPPFKNHAHREVNSYLRRGDIVGVVGHPGKSKKGELSVFATKLQLLSPCLQMLPKVRVLVLVLAAPSFVSLLHPQNNQPTLPFFYSFLTQTTHTHNTTPKGYTGLKNQEVRYRQRYLDLILNAETRRVFQVGRSLDVYVYTHTHIYI